MEEWDDYLTRRREGLSAEATKKRDEADRRAVAIARAEAALRRFTVRMSVQQQPVRFEVGEYTAAFRKRLFGQPEGPFMVWTAISRLDGWRIADEYLDRESAHKGFLVDTHAKLWSFETQRLACRAGENGPTGSFSVTPAAHHLHRIQEASLSWVMGDDVWLYSGAPLMQLLADAIIRAEQ